MAVSPDLPGAPDEFLDSSRSQAVGSALIAGRLSQVLPAATMQLRPLGVVLTTVQVFFSSEA